MSPQEHQLSQSVLEFLIAHQDWFMLDIPPPPQSDPLSSPTSPASADVDDLMLMPSSDEDHSQLDGGWKLVGKDKRRVSRRHTVEHSGARPYPSPSAPAF